MSDDLNSFRLSIPVKEKLRNTSILINELNEGKIPQEIMEFPDESMAKGYQAAYLLFQNEHFRESADAFLFLGTLNPHNHDYWLGLGMSLQRSQEYERAIDAYELAALADIESPVPYFYLAKCLFAIHDRTSALQAIELAIEMADEIEEFSELKKQAEAAKEILLHS